MALSVLRRFQLSLRADASGDVSLDARHAAGAIDKLALEHGEIERAFNGCLSVPDLTVPTLAVRITGVINALAPIERKWLHPPLAKRSVYYW